MPPRDPMPRPRTGKPELPRPAAILPRMAPLILSTSLSSKSRSRILAREAAGVLEAAGHAPEVFDLRKTELPLCDGEAAYGHANVAPLAKAVEAADGVLVATPVYNYDVNAALKTAIELTGKAWTGQAVGFLAAAGGQGSYMSLCGVMNSLMLDFRAICVPRFVYATGDAFDPGPGGEELTDEAIKERIAELCDRTVKLSKAWRQITAQ